MCIFICAPRDSIVTERDDSAGGNYRHHGTDGNCPFYFFCSHTSLSLGKPRESDHWPTCEINLYSTFIDHPSSKEPKTTKGYSDSLFPQSLRDIRPDGTSPHLLLGPVLRWAVAPEERAQPAWAHFSGAFLEGRAWPGARGAVALTLINGLRDWAGRGRRGALPVWKLCSQFSARELAPSRGGALNPSGPSVEDAGARDALSWAEGSLGRAELAPPRRDPPVGGETPQPSVRSSARSPAPPTTSVSHRLAKGSRSLSAVSTQAATSRRRDGLTIRHDPSRASPRSRDRHRRPRANHTAARSCDWTAARADWLPLRVSTALLFPFAPTPAPELQANEKALYRCPPFALNFSPPRRGRGRPDWPDCPRKPHSFTNHRGRCTPSGVSANYKAATAPSRAVSPATPGFTVLNSSSIFLRAGDSDWSLLPLSNFSSSQPQDKANPPSSRSAIFGIFRPWAWISSDTF